MTHDNNPHDPLSGPYPDRPADVPPPPASSYEDAEERTRPAHQTHWVSQPPAQPTPTGQPSSVPQPRPQSAQSDEPLTNPNARSYQSRADQLAYPPPPAQVPHAPAPPEPEGEVPSAIDFLDRRHEAAGLGPANWGWRGALRRMSGGAIKVPMGKAEVAY
ncbi:MAG: hypothetical protein J2O46_02635, partial [Nocardioides sp.]|nr:hypothetical protein [Nocardioides sp.]